MQLFKNKFVLNNDDKCICTFQSLHKKILSQQMETYCDVKASLYILLIYYSSIGEKFSFQLGPQMAAC